MHLHGVCNDVQRWKGLTLVLEESFEEKFFYWVGGGASKSTRKGLSSSGRSIGGRRSCLSGKIPLKGLSAGFFDVLTYLIVRMMSCFSSSS